MCGGVKAFAEETLHEYNTIISGDVVLNFNDDWQPMFKYNRQHGHIPPDIDYVQIFAFVHITGNTDAESLSIESAEYPLLTEEIEIDSNGNFDKKVEVVLSDFDSMDSDTINFSAYVNARKGDKTVRVKIGKGELKTDFLIKTKDDLDQDNDGVISALDVASFRRKYYDEFKAEYDKMEEQQSISLKLYNEWYMADFLSGEDNISFTAHNYLKATTDVSKITVEITDSNKTNKYDYEYDYKEINIIHKFSGVIPLAQSSDVAARAIIKAYKANREVELYTCLRERESGDAIIGDLDGNKLVNSIDLMILRKYVLGHIDRFPLESGFFSADVNDDTTIDKGDCGYFSYYLLGKLANFPKHSVNLSSITPEELLLKPEQISIDGAMYSINAYLWRDFMPFCPPNGQPLICSVELIGDEAVKLPETIDLDRAWIINGDKVWESKFSNEDRSIFEKGKIKKDKVVREGPKWGPGINVDVVVRVIDKSNNEIYYLRASNQTIGRTD